MKELIPNLDHTKETYQIDLANVLNWLGDILDTNDLREELINYSKTINKELAAKNLSASKILLAGKLAYCINRGAKLEQRSLDKIAETLDAVSSTTQDINESDEPKLTNKAKATLAYVYCYSLIDNIWMKHVIDSKDIKNLGDEIRTVIRKNINGKSSILSQLCDHYKEVLNEVKDDKTVNAWLKPLTIIVDTLQLMVTTTKASKKSKKKNNGFVDRKAEKAATNLTFKPEDNNLGVKSMMPHAIIGAKAAVLYNTKTKHCEVYYAQDTQTLSLKGSYITNFDTAKSVTKTLRKPQESLIHWGQAATIRRLEVLLDNTSGKPKPVKGKFNKHIVILKAIH